MVQTLSNAPLPFKGTEIHTLPNGLKIILKKDETIPVAALQIWARCGAIDEAPHLYGISHGLEHMVFKGTPTRTAGEITRHIEGAGGSMNAATQLETTHYYIDIPSYGLETALEVLADTIINPTFPEVELERERLVILEEIFRRDDSPDATLWDEFVSHIFNGTVYGTKVIGSKETVSALTRNDLMNYFKSYYVPSNLTLVIAGDFQKSRILKKCRQLFESMPPLTSPSSPTVQLPPQNGHPSSVSLNKPVQLGYFATGIPSVGLGHPDAVALDVLADVLGGGASSRFYQRLREDRQSVLSIACDFISFQQKGLFAFFGEAFPDKVDAASQLLKEEILRLETDPIQPPELFRAKARIKSEWLHGSETPHGQASTLGSLATLDRLPLIQTYLSQIEALTTADLMDVAKKYVLSHSFHTTVVRPQK